MHTFTARLQADVEAAQAITDSGDEAQIATSPKKQVGGGLFHASVYSYLALNDVQDDMQARSFDVVNYRLPGYGIFSNSLRPNYWFGVPRDVNFEGLVIDVDHLASQVTAKDNDKTRRVNFVKASGARASAMEHLGEHKKVVGI